MSNKIALVTGASRGLGRDMALSLASKGSDIVLTYSTSEAEAIAVAGEIKAMGRKAEVIQLDMSTMNAIDPFISKLTVCLTEMSGQAKFDYLINNAGIGATIPIADVTEEIFDKFLNIHFKGVYFLTQKCLPMINDNGSMVFISSGSVRFSVPGYSVYSSMKAAIENFTKFVAKEYGSRGIRSNVVAPGPVETDFNNAMIRNNPQAKTFLTSMSPLGRVGAADDIGSVVAFICSDEAKWINGQRLEVSGGINL
ncbi:MAG TPA: SDR family oxidoreductase [Bacteroidia bacterium]|nr:SDR family oxidoreductase [Bacteroidia bacterium]